MIASKNFKFSFNFDASGFDLISFSCIFFNFCLICSNLCSLDKVVEGFVNDGDKTDVIGAIGTNPSTKVFLLGGVGGLAFNSGNS